MNKEEAAAFLGVSVRALERYTQQAKISARYEKGRTKPIPVYDQDELATFKAELSKRLAPRPALALEIPPNPSTGDNQAGLALQSASISDFVAGIVNATLSAQNAPTSQKLVDIPIADKPLLPLAEAARLASLSRDYLLDAIHAKKLKAKIIGRGWKIKRTDLDEFIKKL